MRGRNAIIAVALAAVSALGVAPAAQASDLAAAPAICHGATVGSQHVGTVCIEYDVQVMGTLTVGAGVWVSVCVPKLGPCRHLVQTLDETGVEPRTVFPAPKIITAGPTVYWRGGPIGTVWIDGTANVVTVGEVCLGNQFYCP